jgi:methyl-accepting chemotaxis protein
VLAPSSLAGIALLLWLSRSITAPLSRFNDTIEQIRQTNDLSLRVAATSHDELGQASQAFDHMLGQFANILDQVNHSANDLASEIEQFSHTTEDTSASMESQRAQTEQIATAMNEMAATVHEVARNAESAAQAAGQADQASSQGNQVVQNTVSTIQTLASGIEQAAQVIHRLESDSDAIGAVLDVIKNIAEQTNLLALNAAIEAARAGDQGRGFAVVADEVRTLAQRTQESTAEIQSMIERLQAGASEAVKVMNNSSVQAAASVEQANSAGGALQMIIDKVGAITDMNTQIATAAEQQSMVAEEMNQNIVNISRATEQTAASAASTASSAERMVAVVEALTVSAGHFRTSNQSIDLEAAKARHLAWKTRMRSFLDGKSTMSIDQATSHRECALGKWYYSSAREQFAELPEIRELEHPHEQLHKLVKQIVTLKNQGQSKAAEAEYLKIGPLSDRIVAILDRIAHKMRAKSS